MVQCGHLILDSPHKAGRLALLVALIVLSAWPARAQPAPAQETRAERLRARRAEKAANVEPADRPGFLERASLWTEQRISEENVSPLQFNGFTGVLGRLRTGAGLTGGVLYESFPPASNYYLALEASASIRRYWGAKVSAGLERGRLVLYGFGGYRHMPQEAFYGLTAGMPELGRSHYRRNEGLAGVLAGLSLLPRTLFVGVQTSYQSHRTAPGDDGRAPGLQERYDPAAVPAFGADVDYAVLGAWAELDVRDRSLLRGYGSRYAPTQSRLRGLDLGASSGLLLAAEVLHHRALRGAPFTFTRLGIEAQQLVPFRRGYHGFAFREYLTLTRTADPGVVPFFMLPTLGGARTLRGFDAFRFRGRHALLVNAEYRWRVWSLMDLALFADAGQVFREVDDLGLAALELSYGTGFRFRAGRRVFGRFDVAYSREGFQTHFKLGSFL